MFHFWFNTFFVSLDHEEHTVTVKCPTDGRSQTRVAATTSGSTKPRFTVPSTKPVPTTISSRAKQQGVERAQNRAADRVVKSAAVRTSSGNSSANSDTRGHSTSRRASQLLDRPHSVHLNKMISGSENALDHLHSASATNVNETGRSSGDKLHASSASVHSTAHSRSLRGQEPKYSTHTTAANASGQSRPASREVRKTAVGESYVQSARRGNPRSSRGFELGNRKDSVKISHVKAETSTTVHPSTSNGVSENAASNVEVVTEPSAATASRGSVKTASSTAAVKKSTQTHSATSHSVKQPNSTTKTPSAVPHYVKRDLASRRVLPTNRTGTSQHSAVSRHVSDHGSLVSPSVQARSEGVPSDPVSLTGYTPHNVWQHMSPKRERSAPAELQSSAVFDMSGSSGRPTTFCTLTLTKSEIDRANKDVQHKVYSSDFKVSAFYTVRFWTLHIV